MGPILLLLALKLVTLAGSLAITVGFVGLFAFEALDPYKWWLMGIGVILVAIGEGFGYLLARRMGNAAIDDDDAFDQSNTKR